MHTLIEPNRFAGRIERVPRLVAATSYFGRVFIR